MLEVIWALEDSDMMLDEVNGRISRGISVVNRGLCSERQAAFPNLCVDHQVAGAHSVRVGNFPKGRVTPAQIARRPAFYLW
jgi:hypothetical protein